MKTGFRKALGSESADGFHFCQPAGPFPSKSNQTNAICIFFFDEQVIVSVIIESNRVNKHGREFNQ